MALPKLFLVNRDSKTADLALLVIRILAGLTLFVNSGVPKLFHLSSALSEDPLHIGALAAAAMIYAAFALGVCTLLVLVGLATRYAALFATISLAGTFFLIDRSLSANLFDPGHGSHGEIIWLYLAEYIGLVIAGPGRYSLDHFLSRSHSGEALA